MLKSTITLIFDYEPKQEINFPQPCIRDLIFDYYRSVGYTMSDARKHTNNYIGEISKQLEE